MKEIRRDPPYRVQPGVRITFVENLMRNCQRNQFNFPIAMDIAPGSAEWLDDPRGYPSELAFSCPGGCGAVAVLPVNCGMARPVSTGNFQARGIFAWNGNLHRPSLNGGIRLLCRCQWRGLLVDGVFIPA